MKTPAKLGQRNWELIKTGCQTVGLKECYAYIFERLYIEEAAAIREFLTWCLEHDKHFGDANYEFGFREFLATRKPQ